MALKLVSDDFFAYLQPFQLGVGAPRGAEAIVHSIQGYVAHHECSADHVVPQVDLSNAFNRGSQHAVLARVKEVCPSILPWIA